jgi:hypothetical protein
LKYLIKYLYIKLSAMPEHLSPHFTLEEFIFSQTAARSGIDNTPSPEIKNSLIRIAETLEQVRSLIGGSVIRVSSGYRGPALNAAIGGSKTSAHMNGLAADFTAPSFGTVYDLAKIISSSDIVFDQLIHEYGSWVHIGLAPAGVQPRRQLLSIFKGTGYQPGILPVPA